MQPTLSLSALLVILPCLLRVEGQSPSPSNPSPPSDPNSSSCANPPLAGGDAGTFKLQDYLTFLNTSGYTALSSALEQANTTSNGQRLIAELCNGDWTVFAPTNDAFAAVPQSVTSNATALADYLSYHFVYGNLSGPDIAPVAPVTPPDVPPPTSSSPGDASSVTILPVPSPSTGLRRLFRRQEPNQPGEEQPLPTPDDLSNCQLLSTIYPNVTIGRTALNASEFVQLEGNRSQVLAWTLFTEENNVTILNQVTSNNQNVTVGNSTQWRNFFISEINSVLIPPGNITQALTGVNDTSFIALASQLQVPGINDTIASGLDALQSTQGFTLFAPTPDALSVLGDIQSLDPSTLLAVVSNHYVNGSTFYSPYLRELADNSSSSSNSSTSTPIISAAGEVFTFTSNATGLFVSVGNETSAQITHPDILVENGVIHLIDGVLFNTGSDAEQASSAASVHSVAATETSTDTNAIIYPFPTTSSSAMEMPSPTDSAAPPPSMPSSFRLRRGLF